MEWPRRKYLERAIDNDPGAVLQWLEDHLTLSQCTAFADTVCPVDDELRAARLAQAAELVKAYAPQKLVDEIGTKITDESARLKPADGVVARK